MFKPLQSWKQTGLAFSEATLRGPVNPLITFSLPMILTFPSYAVETFPPNEIRDLINHSVSFLSVLSPSPLDMSRHVKNDQPGHSGQGECGSVTPKVMVTLLIAALAPFNASCGRSTKKRQPLAPDLPFFIFRKRAICLRQQKAFPPAPPAPRSCVVPEGSLRFRSLAN